MKAINQAEAATEGMVLSVKNFQTILKTHLKPSMHKHLVKAEELLHKQPEEIQQQWLVIAEAGKFEPDKAILACKNWSEVVSSPFYRPKNIQETFNGSSPSLATLKKYQSEMVAALILCKIIKQTASFFNVGGAINDQQIQETAVLIMDTYHFLNITDFVLCFKMAKQGKFGKLFDRLDGAIVLGWLEEYNELRLIEAQNNSQKKANKRKASQMNSGSSIYKALKDCMNVKDSIKEEPKEVVKMTNQEFKEKRINDLNSLKCMYKKEDFKKAEKKEELTEQDIEGFKTDL